MKRMVFYFLLAMLLVFAAGAEDLQQEIGIKGDAAWDHLLDSLIKDEKLVGPESGPNAIADAFDSFVGKSMIFPEFNFEDFIVDRFGEKYFYYGDPASLNFYIIKYDSRITDQLIRYSYAMGPLGDDNWELLGKITEVYSWWGDIVLMDIQAIRVKGKAALLLEDGKLDFIAAELIDELMDRKAAAGTGDVPEGLTEIPSGLDPMTVAGLYFQLGNVEQNQDVWLKLLSSNNFWGGKPERRVDTWWKNLTKPGRTFFYVRTDEESETEAKYYFQIRQDGEDYGNPKPLGLIFENGEWKIDSGI